LGAGDLGGKEILTVEKNGVVPDTGGE